MKPPHFFWPSNIPLEVAAVKEKALCANFRVSHGEYPIADMDECAYRHYPVSLDTLHPIHMRPFLREEGSPRKASEKKNNFQSRYQSEKAT